MPRLTVIQEALKEAHIMNESCRKNISTEDLMTAGLIGGAKAKGQKREAWRMLRIGYTNGKQLHKRLMMFEIKQEEFAEALNTIIQEENDDKDIATPIQDQGDSEEVRIFIQEESWAELFD